MAEEEEVKFGSILWTLYLLGFVGGPKIIMYVPLFAPGSLIPGWGYPYNSPGARAAAGGCAPGQH